MNSFRNRSFLRSCEFAVAGLLILLVLLLHIRFCQYAGPLWRDEVCRFDVATMPTLDGSDCCQDKSKIKRKRKPRGKSLESLQRLDVVVFLKGRCFGGDLRGVELDLLWIFFGIDLNEPAFARLFHRVGQIV